VTVRKLLDRAECSWAWLLMAARRQLYRGPSVKAAACRYSRIGCEVAA
jgi:hypothetical protein